MAVIQTGQASQATAATQASVTLPSDVTTANLLILFVVNNATSDQVTSVTDNQNNAWVRAATPVSNGSLNSQVWLCYTAQGGPTTVTVKTGAASLQHSLIMREYSALASTSVVVDVISSLAESSATLTHQVHGTTTNANDRAVGLYAGTNPGQTFSNGSGWGNYVRESGAPNLCAVMNDQAFTVAGDHYANLSSLTNDKGIVWFVALESATSTALLPPPSSVTATAGNGSVSVSWPAVSTATAYRIYRSTTINSFGTLVGNTQSSTTFTDNTVTNGTTYYYNVVTLNSAYSESAGYRESPAVTPNATSKPLAPTGLTATPGNAQISLAWGAVATATSYKLYRSLTSGSIGSAAASGLTATQYVDAQVANGVIYYYTVVASNASGDSAGSTQIGASPTAPSGQRTLSWYGYGAAPSGRSLAQIGIVFQQKYQAWKAFCLTQTGMPANMPSNAWRVWVQDAGSTGGAPIGLTFSEGIGYGMILTAFASDPTSPIYDAQAAQIFYGLWTYYNYYKNSNGLMNWRIDASGNVTGQGGATDADQDVAAALVLFAMLHEQGSNGYFGMAATALINAIVTREIFPATDPTHPYLLKNGDAWDPSLNVYMPDYFNPWAYKLFATWTGNTAYWNNVISVNRALAVDYFRNTYSTGYVPDNCGRDGSDQSASGYDYIYGYNAIRMPWREAAFGVNFGDASALAILHELVTYEKSISSSTPANTFPTPSLDGSTHGTGINKAYISGFAVAGVANSADATWANDCISWLVSSSGANEQNYFGQSLECLALLIQTGEFRASGFTYSNPGLNTPLPSGTGVALVQQTSAANNVSGLSASAAFGTNVAIGDLLFAFIVTNNTSDAVANVTDSLGNTWTKCAPGVSNGNLTTVAWYCKSTAAGACTVTVRSSVLSLCEIHLREYSGLDKVSPFDRYASQVETTLTQTHISSLTPATQQQNELIIGAYATTTGGDTFTLASGWANGTVENGASNLGSVVFDKSVTQVAQQQAAVSSGHFDEGVAWTFTFRAAQTGTPPAAPPNLIAVAADNQITLRWGAVQNAAAYNVYRSTTSGGGSSGTIVGTKVATVTTASYVDTDVINGTYYFYEVTAVNVGGESPPSAQYNIAPAASLPVPPSNVVATPGNGQATITWTGSSGANNYDVDRNGAYYTTVPATIQSFTDTGLTNGTTYTYQIVATNASGYNPSPIVSVTPSSGATAPTVPSAPTSLVGAPGNTVVDLSWNDVAGATAYNIYRSTAAGTRGQLINGAGGSSGSGGGGTGGTGTTSTGPTNLNGWKLLFYDPFKTLAAEGQFLSKYPTWQAYGINYYTTYGNPHQHNTGDHYDGGQHMSVISGIAGATDGGNVMQMRCTWDAAAGQAVGCAPEPNINGNGNDIHQLYGRYEIRFRLGNTNLAHWHIAWMLWPKSETWPRDGEIDAPEGDTSSQMNVFMHRQSGTSAGDQDAYQNLGAYGTGWHIWINEWSPSDLKCYLDGRQVAHSTSRVPNTSMRWLLQTENSANPMPAGDQLIYIDYVAAWAYSPSTTAPAGGTTSGGSTGTTTGSTTTTTVLTPWIDPNSIAQLAANAESDPVAKNKLQALANVAQTYWSGYSWDYSCSGVSAAMQDAFNKGTVPSFVAYAITNRDLSGSSAGGAPDDASYIAWVTRFAQAIASQPSVANVTVILEPDALPQMYDVYNSNTTTYQSAWTGRLALLAQAAQIIKTTAKNAMVYVDVGHSAWHTDYHDALNMVNALPSKNYIDGVSLNVSNYQTDNEVQQYGLNICLALGARFQYVYDAGRNARPGPPWDDSQYQNEPAWLGLQATINPTIQRCAFVGWIKRPGESDGNDPTVGDTYGQSAGTWIRQYALNMIDDSVAAGTFTVPANAPIASSIPVQTPVGSTSGTGTTGGTGGGTIQTPVVDATAVGSSDTALTTTWAHTVGSGLTNSMLIVAVGWSGASYQANLVSSVTFNGVAMTAIPGTLVSSNSTSPRNTQLYYLKNPPAGTFNVVVTLTGATTVRTAACSASLQHVDQTTPFGTANGASGSALTSISTTVTSAAATDFVIASVCTRNQYANQGTGLHYIKDYSVGANVYEQIGYMAGGGGSTTPSYSWTTADNAALCAVPIHGAT